MMSFYLARRNIQRPVLYAFCKYLLSVVGPNINKVLQLKRWHFQCQFGPFFHTYTNNNTEFIDYFHDYGGTV